MLGEDRNTFTYVGQTTAAMQRWACAQRGLQPRAEARAQQASRTGADHHSLVEAAHGAGLSPTIGTTFAGMLSAL